MQVLARYNQLQEPTHGGLVWGLAVIEEERSLSKGEVKICHFSVENSSQVDSFPRRLLKPLSDAPKL